jgi:hypothetical protein
VSTVAPTGVPAAATERPPGSVRPLRTDVGRHLVCPQPTARGPLSAWLLDHLGTVPHDLGVAPEVDDHPLDGDDTHLSLYLMYELHYRGVDGVDERWEWHPDLLRLRARLEERFEVALRDAVGELPDVTDVTAFLQRLTTDDGAGTSTSRWLEEHATLDQVREEAVLRTPYQLKEADPHSWALPRMGGRPKAALVEIQADEYGGGVDQEVHAELYALTLEQLGLSSRPNVYLDLVPGVTLATVNLVSMFGLHRRLLGAVVGHLAVFEMSSVTTMARHAATLRRLGFGPWTTLFYDTHVVADAHHQTVAATDLAQGLVHQDPRRLPDVLFGALALCHLEGRMTRHALAAWEGGRSALRGPIPGIEDPAPGRTDVHVPAADPRSGR